MSLNECLLSHFLMSINKRYSEVVSPAAGQARLFNSELLPPEIHVKVIYSCIQAVITQCCVWPVSFISPVIMRTICHLALVSRAHTSCSHLTFSHRLIINKSCLIYFVDSDPALQVVIASMRQLVRLKEGKTAKIKDIPGFLTQCIVSKVSCNLSATFLLNANTFCRLGAPK